MSAITHLYAGVPVTELDARTDWYTSFGRGPDFRAEILWEIGEHATLLIEPDPARSGTGRITLSVVKLDALVESVAARRIDRETIESYSTACAP
jgi:hypothetical protein